MKKNNDKSFKRPLDVDAVLSDLPILRYRQDIIQAVKSHSTTVVIGETGSGKSTQLPQYVLDIVTAKGVVCTQPRRVAAVTIAQRVSKERGCSLGEEVGYTIRFDDKSSPKTKIKYVTDGVLLREMMSDNYLSKYGVVILDEAHERSLQTDILMGLLRRLQDERPDLRVVVMSATLETELFLKFFKDTTLVRVEGRQFPVEIMYTVQPQQNYLDAALQTCIQIYEEEEPGGVLVFLPGQEDIEGLKTLLEEQLVVCQRKNSNNQKSGHQVSKSINIPPSMQVTDQSKEINISQTSVKICDFEVKALYAGLTPEKQLEALTPVETSTYKKLKTSDGQFEDRPAVVQRFILATNIAETSVTVPGIRYVVDSGFVKMRLIQANSFIEMLQVVPVSQAQADQRAGRAGREMSGKCFRLYQEISYETLKESTEPEILRTNLSQTILQLLGLRIRDVNPVTFPYPTNPGKTAIMTGLQELVCLGAVEVEKNASNGVTGESANTTKNVKNLVITLTPLGSRMALLPLEPQLSLLLLKSQEFGCVSEALSVVSLLSTDTKSLFILPRNENERKAAHHAHRRFATRNGDLPALVNIWESWAKSPRNKHWAEDNFLSFRALQHAGSVRDQLWTMIRANATDQPSSCLPEWDPLLRCLAASLFLKVARREESLGDSRPGHNRVNNELSDGGIAAYKTLKGGLLVHIHPSSVLHTIMNRKKLPKHIVYAELLITTKCYVRDVAVIESDWLHEYQPSLFKTSTVTTSPNVTDDRTVNERNAMKMKEPFRK